MALRRDEAEARLSRGDWKQRAITTIVDVLLDPDDSRSRCRVSHEGSPEVFITVPADRSYDGGEAGEEPIQREHLMTRDQELRWLPAATHSQAYKQSLADFSQAQVFNQTTDLEKTATWDWAALRQSRIRSSVAAHKLGQLPRPKSVEELACDRADLRVALANLSRGELRTVLLRFSGKPLNSGERVQLARALDKSQELRKRIDVPVHIVSEEKPSRRHALLLRYWQGHFSFDPKRENERTNGGDNE